MGNAVRFFIEIKDGMYRVNSPRNNEYETHDYEAAEAILRLEIEVYELTQYAKRKTHGNRK